MEPASPHQRQQTSAIEFPSSEGGGGADQGVQVITPERHVAEGRRPERSADSISHETVLAESSVEVVSIGATSVSSRSQTGQATDQLSDRFARLSISEESGESRSQRKRRRKKKKDPQTSVEPKPSDEKVSIEKIEVAGALAREHSEAERLPFASEKSYEGEPAAGDPLSADKQMADFSSDLSKTLNTVLTSDKDVIGKGFALIEILQLKEIPVCDWSEGGHILLEVLQKCREFCSDIYTQSRQPSQITGAGIIHMTHLNIHMYSAFLCFGMKLIDFVLIPLDKKIQGLMLLFDEALPVVQLYKEAIKWANTPPIFFYKRQEIKKKNYQLMVSYIDVIISLCLKSEVVKRLLELSEDDFKLRSSFLSELGRLFSIYDRELLKNVFLLKSGDYLFLVDLFCVLLLSGDYELGDKVFQKIKNVKDSRFAGERGAGVYLTEQYGELIDDSIKLFFKLFLDGEVHGSPPYRKLNLLLFKKREVMNLRQELVVQYQVDQHGWMTWLMSSLMSVKLNFASLEAAVNREKLIQELTEPEPHKDEAREAREEKKKKKRKPKKKQPISGASIEGVSQQEEQREASSQASGMILEEKRVVAAQSEIKKGEKEGVAESSLPEHPDLSFQMESHGRVRIFETVSQSRKGGAVRKTQKPIELMTDSFSISELVKEWDFLEGEVEEISGSSIVSFLGRFSSQSLFQYEMSLKEGAVSNME